MRISFVGAGNMGEAIIAGAIASGTPAADVVVVERRAERAAELSDAHGVTVVGTLAEAAAAATLVLAVKPQDVAGVLDELAPHLVAGQLLISIAAGVTTASIEARVPDSVAVVRVMPNTPALVGEGMAAISAGSAATPAHLERAAQIMGSVGRVITVPEEQQDAVTAVSGSGPAYFFYVVEALIAAGEKVGLARDVATELAVRTFVGAAKLLGDSGEDAGVLRARVTSPGGTTAAAIAAFDGRDLPAVIEAGVVAARDRSLELGAN